MEFRETVAFSTAAPGAPPDKTRVLAPHSLATNLAEWRSQNATRPFGRAKNNSTRQMI